MQDLHPTLNATDQSLLLVFAEIVTDPCAQERADLGEVIGRVETGPVAAFLARDLSQVILVIQESCRHLLNRHDFINETRGRGALWHSAFCRMIDFCLSESKSAMLLDCFQSERAVAARARKNDADGVFSVLFGQRRKESINRSAAFARGGWSGYVKTALVERQCGIRRNDVHSIRGNRHIIFGFKHRHGCRPADEIGQHAFMVW